MDQSSHASYAGHALPSVAPVTSRRQILQATAALAAAGMLGGFARPAPAFGPTRRGATRLRVGVIGCGGRGSGAASDILHASPDTEIFAVADVFPDRAASCVRNLKEIGEEMAPRVTVTPERTFTGFDAFKALLATDCDVVILATPPGFRPAHFAAAIDAGKHVFMEKPVAVDATGIRTVLAAAAKAKEKKLSVVTGTQRRHEECYLRAMERIQNGDIGDVVTSTVYWNQGSLWMNKREQAWSDMEWQLRNWLYFTWLSGDHIVEQHVHNLDVAHWAMGAPPARCAGMGGRQVRTGPEYGHVFDHFAVEYEMPDGRSFTSYCRQIDGCANRVEEVIQGSKGRAVLSSGRAQIEGPKAWKWEGKQENPYVTEHKDFVASITGSGAYLNEAERVAFSTLMAIMGRMSAYTGKAVSWQQAMESKLDLMPGALEMGSIATPEVAVPGKTALI
jgi:predicted dehydrogenase